MCEGTPDREWRGVGLSSYSGNYIVLEQCVSCGTYRVRLIDDMSSLPVVTGLPAYLSPSEETTDDVEEESEDDHDDEDDWLVDS